MSSMRSQPLVLIVDDEPTGRMMMRSALEDAGFEVLDCEDGTRALALFAERQPDLVILDVLMPGIDGFEVCVRLRATPAGSHVPILMVTGLDDLESVNRAYEVGATDFATKPISWLLLSHRVRYLLRAHRTLLQLHESQSWLQEAQSLAHLGHWERDVRSGEERCSLELARILGLSDPAVPSLRDYYEALDPSDRGRLLEQQRVLAETRASYVLELRLRRRDGELRLIRDQGEAVTSGDGTVATLRGTIQDVTEQRQAEAHARFLTEHDALTGLPNRACFADRLNQWLGEGGRDARVAVLCVDLDDFRRVNETLGHGPGDRLLCTVSDTLGAALKLEALPASAGESSLARAAGDEFLVGIRNLGRADDAAATAQHIHDSLAHGFLAEGRRVFLSASIGIAISPLDGDTAEALISAAASAVHQAKRAGKTCYRFYDSSMQAAASLRLSLQADLRRALDREELRLYLQPQVDTQTGRLVGAEALLRWEHPERGLVPPLEFVPFAEETGLIVPIGAWMLRAVCERVAAWRGAGHVVPTIAVNISSRELREPGLERRVAAAIEDSGLPPALLELEITETALLSDTDSTRSALQALRDMGIRVCLDDFGTGYASLGYLKRFPFDSLKIDRSFVKDIEANRHDAAIVAAILALAESLGLDTVAEGVEEATQLHLLRSLGCRVMQGYLFGRPMPVARFEHLMMAGRPFPGAACVVDNTEINTTPASKACDDKAWSAGASV